MKTIKIKNIVVGEGIPKIAVSIMGNTKEKIKENMEKIDLRKVDMIEWRADYFEDVFNLEKVLEVLEYLRYKFIDKPIIFTFRTKEEGGEREIELDYYTILNKTVASSGNVDLVDVQICLDSNTVKQNIYNIHEENILVIGSNHDFLKTPKKEDMIETLKLGEDMGADILKLAVMPHNTEDVLDLLSITSYMRKLAKRPIVTISMGSLGVISRISGGTFGSSITFGAIDKGSAPGQISVDELFNILHSIFA